MVYEFKAGFSLYQEKDGQFIDPKSIAVDSNNNVYIADLFRIQSFAPIS
jgi:Beta-propeller repeat